MKSSGLLFPFFSFLLFCSHGDLHGQPPGTPEEALTAYYGAFYGGEWEKTAAMMHPDALNDVLDLVRSIAQANETSKSSLQAAMGNGFSLDTLDRVDPRRVYTAFLGAIMQIPSMKQLFANSTVQIVGSVLEGETAHVVIRMRLSVAGSKPAETMHVHSARLYNGRWMTLLDEQISSMQTMLAMMMSVVGEKSR